MHFLSLSPLHLLSLALLLQGVLGANPLGHFCLRFSNYSINSPYEDNLHKLMASFINNVPTTGFRHESVGQHPNQIFGLGLCRGDVSSTDCRNCIINARVEIFDRCRYDKEAIIWYDYCELKFSDEDFFGKIDRYYSLYMWNTATISNPELFNNQTKEFLTKVATNAYQSPKLYATGQKMIDASKQLYYGLAQCTRDLSRESCKECLDFAIKALPICCDGKQGGRVIYGSCNIRYELYPITRV